MNNRTRILCVLGVSLLTFLAMPCLSQPRGGRGGNIFMMGAASGRQRTDLLDLPTPLLETCIKLTEAQNKQFDEIRKTVDDEKRALYAGRGRGRDASEESRKAFIAKLDKLKAESNDKAIKVLDKAQRKRLPLLLRAAKVFADVSFPVELIPTLVPDLSKGTVVDELESISDLMAKHAPKLEPGGDPKDYFNAMSAHIDSIFVEALRLFSSDNRELIQKYKRDHIRQHDPHPTQRTPPGPGGSRPPPPGQ